MGTKKQDFEKFVNIIVSIGMNSTMKDIWGAIKDNIKLARIVADDFKVSYTGNIFEDMRQLESAIGNMPFEYEVLTLSQDERLKYKNLNEISINRWKEALDKTELEEGDKEAFLTLASTYIESKCRELYFTKGFYFKSKLAINFYVDKYNPHNMEFNNSVAYSLYLVGARLKKLADHIVYNYETALKKAVILYFMAKNKKDILSSKKPTEKETKELQGLYDELNKYYLLNIGEKCKTIKDQYELTREIVKCFINEKEGIIEDLHPMPTNYLFYGIDPISRNLNNVDKIATQNKTSVFAVNFDEVMKDKKIKCDGNLTAYQKRVLKGAHSAYYNHGEYVTLAQIYTAMGNKSDPNNRQLDKLLNEMIVNSKVWIENKHDTGIIEIGDNKCEFTDYIGSLLPFETVKMKVNGKECDRVIHFLREPPIMSFAKETKQFSIKPKELLEIPLNQTEDNLTLEDYLLDRIVSNTMKETILLSTLYKECGIATRDKKNRSKDKIKTCMEHFVKCNEITSYQITKEKITFKRKKTKV